MSLSHLKLKIELLRFKYQRTQGNKVSDRPSVLERRSFLKFSLVVLSYLTQNQLKK